MVNMLLDIISQYTWRDLGIVLVIALITRWVYKNLIAPFLSPLRKIPGKPYRPLIGNMYEARKSEAMTNAIRWMKELNSLTIRFYAYGGEERLLTADPKFFRHIMVTNVNNYHRVLPTRSPVLSLLKQALFFLSGMPHRHVRKLLNPAFNIKVLEGMLPVFERHSGKVVSAWTGMFEEAKDCDVLQIPVQSYMARITLDSICVTGLDFNPDAISQPNASGVKTLDGYLRQVSQGGLGILGLIFPFLNNLPTSGNRKLWEEEKYISDLIKKTIADKRQKYRDGLNSIEEEPRDLLSLLILARDETGNTIPEDLIFENVAGLMFAGYDTTSITLTWILYLLAGHPDVQQRVRQEVKNVIPDDRTEITHQLLDKLVYMQCVIKEVQRLYPVVSATTRTPVEDDVIDGIAIPAGTKIVLHMGALHRMEQNWPDPEEFKPERFYGDHDHEPYKHLPFITGPHMCIGMKFAQFEMKIVLSCLLRHFEFSLVPGFKVRRIQALSVKPHPPLMLNLKRIVN